MRKAPIYTALFVLAFVLAGILGFALNKRGELDRRLANLISEQGISRFDAGDTQRPELVALGQALFFDKELSGNRDLSCATCHHPTQGSGDGLPLSIGTGGVGLGPERQKREIDRFIARNATEIFNRGADEWRTMFWDSRVTLDEEGGYISPADEQLPEGLHNVLAVQAMFPITSRDEMRGFVGDVDRLGQPNELALIDEDDLPAIWDGVMVRLLRIPAYVDLFQAAFPDTLPNQLGFQHAANAIAAYEAATYSLYDSPWERYLEGERDALSAEAKNGMLLFFGDAGCSECHAGPLFTDQEHHVLAAPQVGPGKGKEAPQDFGRMRETGDKNERYAFRTPPLRNVAATGPWMHDGAYSTLEAVIRHHLDPASALRDYDPAVHLPPQLQDAFQDDPVLIEGMLQHLDSSIGQRRMLNDEEIAQLIAFLEALTDPACYDMTDLIPSSVPSGLPVSEDKF